MTSTLPTIAVIGLGAMGLPMATRLAETFRVIGVDIAAERRDLAADHGIAVTGEAREAVEEADAVLLMVRTPAQLEDAIDAERGFGAGLRSGTAVIVSSTIGIDAMRAAEQTLAERNVHLVDAPVSGGPVRAGKGDLLIVVGGSPAARDVAEPFLSALASSLVVIGDHAGDGQAFKTVNQLLCGVHIAAAAEALALAQRLGLDPAATLTALQGGAAASFMLGDRGPRAVAGLADGEEPVPVGSRIDIFVKDLGLVTSAASSLGMPAPVASAAHQLFLLGQAAGLEAEDDSQVVRLLV